MMPSIENTPSVAIRLETGNPAGCLKLCLLQIAVMSLNWRTGWRFALHSRTPSMIEA